MRRGWLVVVMAVVVAIVVLQVRDHPEFSRVDELQHFDYALKSPSAGVRIGELYGVEATKAVNCRGIDLPGWEPGTSGRMSECGDPQPDPTLTHSVGYNTAYLHTPVYYTATALAGEMVLRLPGIDSKLTAYRLVGVLWLAAGLLLVWYGLGLVGLTDWGRAAVVGLLGVSPMVVHASAFLNPDATALLGGGLLAVALLKWESGHWQWWTLPAASIVAVGMKQTNAAAVGALVLYLAVRVWQRRDQRHQEDGRARIRAWLLAIVSSVGVTFFVVLGWRLLQAHRQLVTEKSLPIHTNIRFDSFQWASLDGQLRAVVTPFRDQWIPDTLPASVLGPLGGAADVGLLALLGVSVAVASVRSPTKAMVSAVFAAMVGTGVLTMISFYLAMGLDAPVPARYGLALLPVTMVAIAPVLSRYLVTRLLMGALACATAAAMMYGVLYFDTKPVDGATTNRDQLITDQEQLLNAYRCKFNVDVHVVPGRCDTGDLGPTQDPAIPKAPGGGG